MIAEGITPNGSPTISYGSCQLNRTPFRKKLPLIGTLCVLFGLMVAYIVGGALVQSRRYTYYEFDDLLMPRFWGALTILWLLYCGSAIGSFLNVVAWRMPRGESINGRSHCPRCANRLLGRDNVPVLGWISLLGRCRFCSLPISRRYPIVEATVGLSLACVGLSQIYCFALPGQTDHWHGGPLWAPRLSPLLIAVLVYHVTALATLWGMALIRMDGTRIPNALLISAAVVLLLPMLCYPTFMIVPWQTTRPDPWSPVGLYYDAIMRVVTALVAAALAGRVLAKGLCPTADLKMDPLGKGTARLVDLIAMLAIPAVLIGWQSIAAIVVVAAILTWIANPLIRSIPINDGPRGQIEKRGVLERFAFALPLATTLQLILWRRTWNLPYWPDDKSNRFVIIAWAMGMLLVPLFLKDATAQEPEAEGFSAKGFKADGSAADDFSADELPDAEGEQESDD